MLEIFDGWLWPGIDLVRYFWSVANKNIRKVYWFYGGDSCRVHKSKTTIKMVVLFL
jgi:hypothetical protein